MGVCEDDKEFRSQLSRILEHPEFLGSQRVSRFLAFVSEAAFAGRTHLDQSEIAQQVLENKQDFNPLDDASVRRLATLARHKLEKYYQTSGRDDRVVVMLPARGYVPRYSLRGEPLEAAPAVQVERGSSGFSKRTWMLGGVAALLLAASAVAFFMRTGVRAAPEGQFQIVTERGDIMHGAASGSPRAILLGPKVGPFEDVTVRMVFTADAPNQQAGIMIFESPDRYVKLARHFNTRTQLEFGIESGGRYQKTTDTFTYDPTGQSGGPIWLSIRRQDKTYRAFISGDSLSWRSVGGELETNDPMLNARVAIFGFNGTTEAPSREATFDHLSLGINFHDLPDGPAFLMSAAGWTNFNGCEPDGKLERLQDRLAVFLPRIRRQCNWYFSRPLPAGDWSYVTLFDFLSQGGSYAGLKVTSKTNGVRLIRWTLSEGAITLEQREQVSRKDFPGSPPVFLRMESRNGVLTAGYSRDGVQFEAFPASIPLRSFGQDLRIGANVGRSSWTGEEELPPAQFFYIRQEIRTLTPYR